MFMAVVDRRALLLENVGSVTDQSIRTFMCLIPSFANREKSAVRVELGSPQAFPEDR